MRVKQRLVIRDPNEFLRGDFTSCFGLYSPDCPYIPDDWIQCGDIEFEVDANSADVIMIVTDIIKQQIAEERETHLARVAVMENRLSELLALEAPGDNP